MAVANSLVQKEKKLSFSNFLTQDIVKHKINEIVGGKESQKFMTSILSAVTNNPSLQECDFMSILNCAFLGEGLKLSPSPQLGQYYMVPFNDSKKGCKVAQFQLGYKGYIQLAERTGVYRKLNVLAIKEGELVKYDPLNEEIEVNIIEDETIREKAATIGYYAMFEYLNGFRKTLYWSKEKMEAHANQYSQGYRAKKGYTFWEKDFDAMAFKTMLRQLISKWGIMSIDMQEAYTKDMAVIEEDGKATYIDNEEMSEEVISTVVTPNEQQKEIVNIKGEMADIPNKYEGVDVNDDPLK